MRMAELSRESGVPVATIKYYLREGVLPAGERTNRNQASYGDEHLRRLKLVRALVDIGGLSIAQVREVIEAIASEARPHQVLGLSQGALTLPTTDVREDDRAQVLKLVKETLGARGWEVKEDSNPVQALVSALCAFRAFGWKAGDGWFETQVDEWFETYVDAAGRIAEVDLDTVVSLATVESIVETAVVGTVLGDLVFDALRRIAQSHVSAQRFGAP